MGVGLREPVAKGCPLSQASSGPSETPEGQNLGSGLPSRYGLDDSYLS